MYIYIYTILVAVYSFAMCVSFLNMFRAAFEWQEPSGGRSIMIQWPTVVHATAYVVELYEETAQTVERFHRH